MKNIGEFAKKVNIKITNKDEIREKVNVKLAQRIIQRVKEFNTTIMQGDCKLTLTQLYRGQSNSDTDTVESNLLLARIHDFMKYITYVQ